VNFELKKQIHDQKQEIEERIRDEARCANSLSAAQKKICALQERINDVRYSPLLVYL